MTTLTAPPAPAARTYVSLRAAWIPLFALCLAFFVEMVAEHREVEHRLRGAALVPDERDEREHRAEAAGPRPRRR